MKHIGVVVLALGLTTLATAFVSLLMTTSDLPFKLTVWQFSQIKSSLASGGLLLILGAGFFRPFAPEK